MITLTPTYFDGDDAWRGVPVRCEDWDEAWDMALLLGQETHFNTVEMTTEAPC